MKLYKILFSIQLNNFNKHLKIINKYSHKLSLNKRLYTIDNRMSEVDKAQTAKSGGDTIFGKVF